MTAKVDMDAPRTFFDPHPGFAGAAIPIPGLVRAIAQDLDGETLSLREAVTRLRTAGIGTVEVVEQHQYIGLRLGGGGNPEHFFRVIRYR